MEKSLLIIFVKNPILGEVKTRLATSVGDEMALRIYERLLQKTHQETHNLGCDKTVYYHAFVPEQDIWSDGNYDKALQIEGSLGQKMSAAFQNAFQSGYKKVAIIGSDCYELSKEILLEALEKLNTSDAVIGPSEDGGYYLLGMRSFLPEVFENKIWSTSTVFKDTIASFKTLKQTIAILPELNDVDEERDLGEWAKEMLKNKDTRTL